MLNQLVREPLLHFLLIGAGLFILFYEVNGLEGEDPENQVVITEADINHLSGLFSARMQRPPTQQELDGLIEAQIKEEILYREALVMGLDRDDIVIRRHLAQKVGFLFNDLTDAGAPDDEELLAYLETHSERFIEPAVTTFKHVYFSADRHDDEVAVKTSELLTQLNKDPNAVDLSRVGDPFMFDAEFDALTPQYVGRFFGLDFARSLDNLEVGKWNGPISSAYGVHLVYVSDRTKPRMPELNEVRSSVMNDLMNQRRNDQNKAFYQALRDRYDVVVETPEALQATAEK